MSINFTQVEMDELKEHLLKKCQDIEEIKKALSGQKKTITDMTKFFSEKTIKSMLNGYNPAKLKTKISIFMTKKELIEWINKKPTEAF